MGIIRKHSGQYSELERVSEELFRATKLEPEEEFTYMISQMLIKCHKSPVTLADEIPKQVQLLGEKTIKRTLTISETSNRKVISCCCCC